MRFFLRPRVVNACFACRHRAFATASAAARKHSPQSSSQRSWLDERIRTSRSGSERNIFNLRNEVLNEIQTTQTSNHAYKNFRTLVFAKFDKLFLERGQHSFSQKKHEYGAFGVRTEDDFFIAAKRFRGSIYNACRLAALKRRVSRDDNPLFHSLRSAFAEENESGLERSLIFNFRDSLMTSSFPAAVAATQKQIADCRYPHEWFPATRALQRTVHVHVGPTNSGKTYHALKALENSKSGIYAGPLRLLAHEVYSRFLAAGKPCALVTGEELRIPEDIDSYFYSCTVEMTNLNRQVDVAVIDEIQMISDPERGWGWTQAFLGVQAREVHVCGEERAVELIEALCASTGDKVVVHRYKRLSALKTMNESLNNNLGKLQKGDAVVAFSRVAIHSLKKQIENATKKRCAVVYGGLPPETRAEQAALFNDPDNDYDYLCASDAIGMGLNLEIKRVVFEATTKRHSHGFGQLSTSSIKQIGGRAGRFKSASQAMKASAGQAPDPSKPGQPGLVTAFDEDDLFVIGEAFKTEVEPLKAAGLQPSADMIERFSSYFPPNIPLSYILARLREVATLSSKYFLCGTGPMIDIADLIQPYPMTIYDRLTLLSAPVNLKDEQGTALLQAMARCISEMRGDLVDIPEIPLEILEDGAQDKEATPAIYLHKLEFLHGAITLYLWLTYRFSGIFRSQNLAFHVKEMVEARISKSLADVSLTTEQRAKMRRQMRRRAQLADLRKREVLDDSAVDDGPRNETPPQYTGGQV
ncbi:P-loop containing nucleoside triphosphate hydrolase protein [Xylariaceae sp. FL0804]|nr:P-loop containing nucleoside triphosphate hydrolase protein [Xylariaceae sp. FL0804]